MSWLNLSPALIASWLQVVLLVTGASVFIGTEWRLVLLALLVQYFAAGMLLAQAGLSAAAGVLILTGAIACAIVYVTARSGSGTSLQARRSVADWVLRFVTIGLIAVGVFGVAQPGEWLMISAVALAAALWLAAVGFLTAGLSRSTLRIGLGLLTFQTGFALLYLHLDAGLVVIGLLGSINLMLALVVSFLALAWGPTRP